MPLERELTTKTTRPSRSPIRCDRRSPATSRSSSLSHAGHEWDAKRDKLLRSGLLVYILVCFVCLKTKRIGCPTVPLKTKDTYGNRERHKKLLTNCTISGQLSVSFSYTMCPLLGSVGQEKNEAKVFSSKGLTLSHQVGQTSGTGNSNKEISPD